MDDVTTVRGECATRGAGEPATLTFEPVPGKPYLRRVTCGVCGETWTTTGKPEEFAR